LHRVGPDVSRVLVSREDSLRLTLLGEQGESTLLYQHESQRLGGVLSSPDGRWIMFASPDATFVAASDGKTPTRELGPAIDLANIDRTGRFLVGRLTRSLASPTGVEWKMWRLDAAEAPIDVAPGGFQHRSGMVYWIQ
jgi:hypothetical protein